MSSNKAPLLKASISALVVGVLVAFGLYNASNWFFSAKNKQTLIKSSELGQIASGEVVFPIGAKLPNVVLDKLLNAKGSYDLSKDPTKLRIVNFWASWCEPCVEEFSSFARLMKELDGQVSFVGISEDKTEEGALEFLKAFSTDFQGLENIYFGFDQNKAYSNKYGLLALPESFIVDQDGKLIRRVSGFEDWDAPGAVEYFKFLLKKQGGGK